jgi:hypothetical protein
MLWAMDDGRVSRLIPLPSAEATARIPAARRLTHGLRLAAATGLGIDAFVHATSAGQYDGPVGGFITAGNLFRAEAVVAILLAVLLLIHPTRLTWLAVLVVAASALGAVVLYRYVDVGPIGPLPDLYEPTWQVPGKLASAYAEGGALVLSALALWRSQVVSSGPARFFGRRG